MKHSEIYLKAMGLVVPAERADDPDVGMTESYGVCYAISMQGAGWARESAQYKAAVACSDRFMDLYRYDDANPFGFRLYWLGPHFTEEDYQMRMTVLAFLYAMAVYDESRWVVETLFANGSWENTITEDAGEDNPDGTPVTFGSHHAAQTALNDFLRSAKEDGLDYQRSDYRVVKLVRD